MSEAQATIELPSKSTKEKAAYEKMMIIVQGTIFEMKESEALRLIATIALEIDMRRLKRENG